MEQLFFTLFSWQFLFLCIGIGAVVFVVRYITEFIIKNFLTLDKDSTLNKFWGNLVLPIMPIGVGLVFTLYATGYPYPEGFEASSGRAIFGLVAGFSSGLIVRLYKSLLSNKVTELVSKVSGLLNKKD